MGVSRVPKKYDAVLMIAYGGPEKLDDIRPYLSVVASGRPIPPARLEEVAHHYELIGGKSPINELTYRQAGALNKRLADAGYAMPVYVGMRNWHPFIADTVKRMRSEGVQRALGVIMAAHRCDASWQRYQRDVDNAMREAGVSMEFDYTPALFDHPLFIEASAELIAGKFDEIPPAERDGATLLFTAHSIPAPMAEQSPYVSELQTSCALIAQRLGRGAWTLCYQSRSGRPEDAWLEPDVCSVIKNLGAGGVKRVVIQPVGFLCDHVEVLFDIGIEAQEAAEGAGIHLHRAETVNDHPKFIAAIADAAIKKIGDS
ncbi:MAG: ferrochelatase [Deltaproteobacteria bacterium]